MTITRRAGSHAGSCLLVLAATLCFPAAQAHHSAAMLYDLGKEVTMEGVVTEYELGNPHMRIYFDVDNAGQTEQWMAEGGSRTVLMRKGWDGTEVAPGDHVRIRGNPSRDGSKLIHVEYLILDDGTELFAEDFDFSGALEGRRRTRQ
jgi:Family of unknown function (DUF6152)